MRNRHLTAGRTILLTCRTCPAFIWCMLVLCVGTPGAVYHLIRTGQDSLPPSLAVPCTAFLFIVLMILFLHCCTTQGAPWVRRVLSHKTRHSSIRDLGFEGSSGQGLFVRRRSWPETRKSRRVLARKGHHRLVMRVAGMILDGDTHWMPSYSMHERLHHLSTRFRT